MYNMTTQIYQLLPCNMSQPTIIIIIIIIIIIVTEQTAQLICSGKKSNHKMNLAT